MTLAPDAESQIPETNSNIMQRSTGFGRLSVKQRSARTCIDRFAESGCAKIRLPRPLSPGPLEAVLINTSGGVTGGDSLAWEFELAPNTEVTVTTQAAEKVYRASSGRAHIETRVKIGDGACMHWLPQETILFDQSALQRRLDIDLAPGARLMACETLVFGRHGRGEKLRRGSLLDDWRIRVGGNLIHAEALRISGAFEQVDAGASLLAGNGAIATVLLCGHAYDANADAARESLNRFPNVISGLSIWTNAAAGAESGKLLARLAARDSYTLKQALIPLLELLKGNAPLPKSWAF